MPASPCTSATVLSPAAEAVQRRPPARRGARRVRAGSLIAGPPGPLARVTGRAGVTEVPHQHQRGGQHVEGVQEPDRPERQAGDVHRVDRVADVGEHEVAAAVGRQVAGAERLDQHGQVAGDEQRMSRPSPRGARGRRTPWPTTSPPRASAPDHGDPNDQDGRQRRRWPTWGAPLRSRVGDLRGHEWTPSRCAIRAASCRPTTSSLRRMLDTCTDAVFTLMKSSSAISRLVCPAARAPSTSRSRSVSP